MRILARHSDEYVSKLLPLVDDLSNDVVCATLLALRDMRGNEVDAAIARVASRYKRNDRYLLEAINVAAADRTSDIYARWTATHKPELNQIQLIQLLNPDAAIGLLKKELLDGSNNTASRMDSVLTIASIPSIDAGRILLEVLNDDSAPTELRKLALEVIAQNLSESWSELGANSQFNAVFARLLHDKVMATPVLQVIGRQNLSKFTSDVLEIVSEPTIDDTTRCQAIQILADLKATDCLKSLRDQLSSPSAMVRDSAFSALIDLNDVETYRTLFTSPSNESDSERRLAYGQAGDGLVRGCANLARHDPKCFPRRQVEGRPGYRGARASGCLCTQFVQRTRSSQPATKASTRFRFSGPDSRPYGRRASRQTGFLAKQCFAVQEVPPDSRFGR